MPGSSGKNSSAGVACGAEEAVAVRKVEIDARRRCCVADVGSRWWHSRLVLWTIKHTLILLSRKGARLEGKRLHDRWQILRRQK